jgi:hypothetical protein
MAEPDLNTRPPMDAYASGDAASAPRFEDGISEVPCTEADALEDSLSPSGHEVAALMCQAFGVQLSTAQISPTLVRRVMMDRGLPENVPDRVLVSLAAYAKESRKSRIETGSRRL